MPDETDIARFEQILTDITRLGGDKERTSMVPNLVVVDPAPTGLTDFITIVDERDGDTILAKTVPDVIYAASDKVNVLFVEGTEPIAFQQGSGSSSSGIWGIVPSTSTDIFYNSGDVGIGKSVAPDARLEILDTAQAQLRLTHTEDTKFVDFTLDTNHDLTITTSSTGQIILQPTTDSVDFFQVLDADGGEAVLTVDSTNENVLISNDLVHLGDPDNKIAFTDDAQTFTVGGEVLLTLTEAGQDVVKIGDGGDVDINFNDMMFMRGSDGFFGINITAPSTVTALLEAATAGNKGIVASAWSTTATFAGEPTLTLAKSHNASIGTLTETIDTERLGRMDITGVDSNDAIRSTAGFRVTQIGAAGVGNVPSALDLIAANNLVIMRLDQNRDVIIGGGTTSFAQLTIDQPSTTAAQPVLYLDQADVSEEMIELNTTIGVGNAIEAVGAKTLTVTHFVKYTIPGGLTRYSPLGTIA